MGGCAGPFPPRGWVAWRKVPYPAQGVAKKVYCPREYLVSSTKAERRKHGKIDGLAWNFCFENYADIVCLRAVNFLAKKVVLIICCPFFGCKTEDHVLYSSLFIYCFFFATVLQGVLGSQLQMKTPNYYNTSFGLVANLKYPSSEKRHRKASRMGISLEGGDQEYIPICCIFFFSQKSHF